MKLFKNQFLNYFFRSADTAGRLSHPAAIGRNRPGQASRADRLGRPFNIISGTVTRQYCYIHLQHQSTSMFFYVGKSPF